jgi:hypothetical protein
MHASDSPALAAAWGQQLMLPCSSCSSSVSALIVLVTLLDDEMREGYGEERAAPGSEGRPQVWQRVGMHGSPERSTILSTRRGPFTASS